MDYYAMGQQAALAVFGIEKHAAQEKTAISPALLQKAVLRARQLGTKATQTGRRATRVGGPRSIDAQLATEEKFKRLLQEKKFQSALTARKAALAKTQPLPLP